MFIGWVADPRTHLAAIAIGIGVVWCYPGGEQVTREVAQFGLGAIDEVGHRVRVALGHEICQGHIVRDSTSESGLRVQPCWAMELSVALRGAEACEAGLAGDTLGLPENQRRYQAARPAEGPTRDDLDAPIEPTPGGHRDLGRQPDNPFDPIGAMLADGRG